MWLLELFTILEGYQLAKLTFACTLYENQVPLNTEGMVSNVSHRPYHHLF